MIKRIVLFTLELKDWPESNTDDRVTTNAECEDAIVRVRRANHRYGENFGDVNCEKSEWQQNKKMEGRTACG